MKPDLTSIGDLSLFYEWTGGKGTLTGHHFHDGATSQWDYTESEMAQIDERLPHLVNHVLCRARKCRTQLLLDSISYWGDQITLLRNNNANIKTVGEIDSVFWMPDNNFVIIHATTYQTSQFFCHQAEQTLEFATAAEKNNHSVTLAWMDYTYPGWRERWMLCDTLGVSPKEMAAAICTTVPTGVTCTAPDIPEAM